MIDGTCALFIGKRFSVEECDSMSQYMKTHGKIEEAQTYSNDVKEPQVDHKSRKGTVYALDGGQIRKELPNELFPNRIYGCINEWRRVFGHSPQIVPGALEYQLAVYDDPGDKFTLHRDHSPGLSQWTEYREKGTMVRKVSMSIMLSDQDEYEGAGFRFETLDGAKTTRVDLAKGDVVIFPSWHLHQVDPLISGKREALVVWAHGDFWL